MNEEVNEESKPLELEGPIVSSWEGSLGRLVYPPWNNVKKEYEHFVVSRRIGLMSKCHLEEMTKVFHTSKVFAMQTAFWTKTRK